jgi:hypothetical protein
VCIIVHRRVIIKVIAKITLLMLILRMKRFLASWRRCRSSIAIYISSRLASSRMLSSCILLDDDLLLKGLSHQFESGQKWSG